MNTHRRPVRPVTPVSRVGRGTAGVAIAASFVLTGSTGAVAQGTVEASGEAQAASVAASLSTIPVAIPVANATQDASVFGAITVNGPELTAKVSSSSQETEAKTDSAKKTDSAATKSEKAAPKADSDSQNAEAASTSSKKSESADAAASKDSSSASQAVAGGSIYETAQNGIGVPYVSGGTTPSGWDCSGFVQWVYRQHGIELPRTADAQAASATRISASEAQPGDLVFFPGHIGIYAGNGRILDAGNHRTNTSERSMWSANWSYYRVTK